MVTNEEIWNQSLPPNFKQKCSFMDTPFNRKTWAQEIWGFIEVIEESSHGWDERNITILDDAYDYCDAYGIKEVRDKIKELHTRFFEGQESLTVDMNYLRSFFHDEWIKPLDNSWLEPTLFEEK